MKQVDIHEFNAMGAEGWRFVKEEGIWTTWEREIV